MRLLYDVTQLGLAQVNPIHQAGIYRVVVELLLQLLQQPDLELALFSAKPGLAYSARRYVKASDALQALPYVLPVLEDERALSVAAYDALDTLKYTVTQQRQNNRGWQRHAWTVKRELLDWLFPENGLDYAGQFARQAAAYDAVHVLFSNDLSRDYAFPASLQRFVTVYDLIPLLCETVRRQDPCLASKQKRTLQLLTREDHIFCISEATRQDLLAYRSDLAFEQTTVIPLGASDKFYPCDNGDLLRQVRQSYGIPADAPYLLSLCTLAIHKNLPRLLEAFLSMVSEQRDTELRLVLTGANRGQHQVLQRVLQRYPRHRDQVVFTGYVADVDLAPLYSGALGFTFVSLYEGFGLPILEALQCGTPVLCSNTSSMPEVAGEAALLVDPHDKDAIAGGLLRLLSDEKLRLSLREKGLERARHYSWQRCAEVTSATYQRVCGIKK